MVIMSVLNRTLCPTLKGWKIMRMFGFWRKETGANTISMAMTLWVVFGFFCDEHFLWWTFLVPSLKNTAFIFPEILFFQCFTFKSQTPWHHNFLNLHNTKTSVSLKQKGYWYSKKENTILIFFKSSSYKQQLFFIS